MSKRFVRGARFVLVTAGVVALTSFTVDATLTGGGLSQSALGILARSVAEEVSGCPLGTGAITIENRVRCIDLFEASPSPECPRSTTVSAVDTRSNLDARGCAPLSREGSQPWTFVTLSQAQELCARAGKSLLSSGEWFKASLGVVDAQGGEACNVRGTAVSETGSAKECVSGIGAYDMIGNVWEWVDGEVIDGIYEERQVPPGGYVSETDTDGFVTKTGDVPNPDYHLDYFWSSNEGTYGILRGGFYGSGDDAGLYSIQAKTVTSFSGAGIGFRCISDPA